MPVLDEETGQTLKFRQLRRHPKYKDMWVAFYANERGRLYQGIGKGDQGPKKQQVKGTLTITFIRCKDIPLNKRGGVYHSCVVCKVRPKKDDPNRTRITVAGGDILYPGDVAIPTGSLELIKMMISSILL